MKPEQSVLNKLAKFSAKEVELSAEPMKVEFAAVDDLKEVADEAYRIEGLQEDAVKWGKMAEDEINDLKLRLSDAEGIIRNAQRSAANHLKESQPILNKIEVSAKELGIDVNSIPNYKRAVDNLNTLLENQNQVSGWYDFLKKNM